MANRVIRNWTQSDRINNLSEGAEIFFTRLIMTVDDYGCFHANPKILLASLFPLKSYSINDIGDWLTECRQQDLIVTYLVEKKLYLQILDFKQTLRRPKHLFPTSDGHCRTSVGQVTDIVGQVTAEKKRKEIEKEVEDEQQHFQNLLLNDNELKNHTCKTLNCTVLGYVEVLKDFFSENNAIHKKWLDLHDCNKHFVSWLRYYKPKENVVIYKKTKINPVHE